MSKNTSEETLEITKEAYELASPELKEKIDKHMKFKSYARIKQLTELQKTEPVRCEKRGRKIFATKGSVKVVYGLIVSIFLLLLTGSDIIANWFK